MQAKLHLIKGNPQGKTVEIPSGTLMVGRAEESNLIIASTRVSRHHCEIVNDQKQLVIRDKGSGNGTFVNGVTIQEQVLAPGDEVRVGPLTFVVEIDGVRERAARPTVIAAPVPPAAKAKPPVKVTKMPKMRKGRPADILSSLENLAGPKKTGDVVAPEGKEESDLMELTEEDLLDP